MVNSSLRYEILLYLNSFYFGFFAACEVGMAVLKCINNPTYTQYIRQRDLLILAAVLGVETVRVYFGRKGALSDHGNIHIWMVPWRILYGNSDIVFCFRLQAGR